MQQSLVHEYDCARHQYRQADTQYSARVNGTGQLRFTQYCANALQDLFFYTSATDPSACCEPSMCTHGVTQAGLHELNQHLRRSARHRLRTAPTKHVATAAGVFALLVRQEAAELAELLEMEAAGFRKVGCTYYDQVYGPADRPRWAEAQSRKNIEAEHSAASKELVLHICEAMWVA